MIGMTPDFCNLTYKPIEVNRLMLKCDLQKKLMTTVTKKIWHEKLAYDLEEIIGDNLTKLQWHKNPETSTAVYELNDAGNAYKLDGNGNQLPVFYNDGDMWASNPSFNAGQPVSNTNRPYLKDAMGQPTISATGTVNPETMDADSSAYIKNLSKLNRDIANFYIKYRNSGGEADHIAHCLKKHFTHYHMDFYCLTATGERINMADFDQTALDTITAQMLAHFTDATDYEMHTTTDGAYIRTASNQINADGDVVATDVANEFTDPSDRTKANTQDFTDEANVTEN